MAKIEMSEPLVVADLNEHLLAGCAIHLYLNGFDSEGDIGNVLAMMEIIAEAYGMPKSHTRKAFPFIKEGITSRLDDFRKQALNLDEIEADE